METLKARCSDIGLKLSTGLTDEAGNLLSQDKCELILTSGAASTVDVTVTVEQVGVAPFYYPLGIMVRCPDGIYGPLPGVDALVDPGQTESFTFTGLPATEQCLGSVSISLASKFAYEDNPVRFAQGVDGRAVEVALPLPPKKKKEKKSKKKNQK